jgi:hypothetical protein
MGNGKPEMIGCIQVAQFPSADYAGVKESEQPAGILIGRGERDRTEVSAKRSHASRAKPSKKGGLDEINLKV